MKKTSPWPESWVQAQGGAQTEAQPGSVLDELREQQKAQQWDRMVVTLRQIADDETDPTKKSRYVYTMGQLYRDKLDDPMRAVELFEEALDLDPTYVDAFERIHKVLTPLGEWRTLERSYRRMIQRVSGKGNNELEGHLWYALGLIYRDRLDRADVADECFRMAERLKSG
jgi:golgin subfamily B member 1